MHCTLLLFFSCTERKSALLAAVDPAWWSFVRVVRERDREREWPPPTCCCASSLASAGRGRGMTGVRWWCLWSDEWGSVGLGLQRQIGVRRGSNICARHLWWVPSLSSSIDSRYKFSRLFGFMGAWWRVLPRIGYGAAVVATCAGHSSVGEEEGVLSI